MQDEEDEIGEAEQDLRDYQKWEIVQKVHCVSQMAEGLEKMAPFLEELGRKTAIQIQASAIRVFMAALLQKDPDPGSMAHYGVALYFHDRSRITSWDSPSERT